MGQPGGQKKWGEFDLIDDIRSRVNLSTRAVPVGPGDDCAVIRTGRLGLVVITTDMIVEGTHFDLNTAGFESVGDKAYASALSDVAAMGLKPTCGVVAVALPRHFTMGNAKRLERGLKRVAEKYGVPIVGGDVTGTGGGLVVAVTIFGEARGKLKPVLRSGARKGHWILVTGSLGGSILGRHLKVSPRIAEGLYLNRNFRLGAMIDVSDGLAGDLGHIIRESRVGAIIDAQAVPISKAAKRLARNTGHEPLDHALTDGEDYELLFTTSPGEAKKILARPPKGVPVTVIGRITSGPGIQLRRNDGTCRPIKPRGYEHMMG